MFSSSSRVVAVVEDRMLIGLPEYIAVKVTPPYEAPEGPKPPSTSAPESPTPPSISTELFAPAEVANTITEPPEFHGGGLGVDGGIPFSDIMSLDTLQPRLPPVESSAPVVIGGELKPPRKIHGVTPIYPAIARQARKVRIPGHRERRFQPKVNIHSKAS